MDEEEQKWRQRALAAQRLYFNAYSGALFHRFHASEYDLLRAKIAFALYGPPVAEDSEDYVYHSCLIEQYTSAQREHVERIYNRFVRTLPHETGAPHPPYVDFMVLFAICNDGTSEFSVPIFSARIEVPDRETFKPCISTLFIDRDSRIYMAWSVFRTKNNFPPMKYCLPFDGAYTPEFAVHGSPLCDFDESPSSSLTSKIVRASGTVASAVSVGAATVALASMASPAPILGATVLAQAALAGTVSSAYMTALSFNRLLDRGFHHQSLSDLHSLSDWLTVAVAPVTAFVELTEAVIQGDARSSAAIRFLRTSMELIRSGSDVLSHGATFFAVASFLQGVVQSAPTPAELLHFSTTVFFFSNTLISTHLLEQLSMKARKPESEAVEEWDRLDECDAARKLREYLATKQYRLEIRPIIVIDCAEELLALLP